MPEGQCGSRRGSPPGQGRGSRRGPRPGAAEGEKHPGMQTQIDTGCQEFLLHASLLNVIQLNPESSALCVRYLALASSARF